MVDEGNPFEHLDGGHVDALRPEGTEANVKPGRIGPGSLAVVVREAAVVAR